MSRLLLALPLLVSIGCDPEGSTGEGSDAQAPGVGGKADGAGAVESVRPPFVTLVNNSRQAQDPLNPAYPELQLPTTSGPALDDALSELAGDLDFAAYPFSGCHDRAHATYLHLARSLGSDAVAKVWVFSPTLLTVALEGAIEGPSGDPGWGAANTSWDYHVAAVVRAPSGLRVVDPVLADLDESLSLDEWFSAMEIPAGSAYTMLEGHYYSFNTAGASSWSGGRMPFNGSMFDYVGVSRSERWLEENLARDAVAVALLEGSGCSYLRQVLLDPQTMVQRLGEMAAWGTTSTCKPYLQVYLDETWAWSGVIDELMAG